MLKYFTFFSPGHLPVHHQTTKGTRRHQESSVQQILLPAGGEEAKEGISHWCSYIRRKRYTLDLVTNEGITFSWIFYFCRIWHG